MGLSIAVAGGIICITVLAIFSIVFSQSDQVYVINSARTKSTDIQNILFHTNMTIDDITAEAGSQFVNFTLTNTGNEKFWNYGDFDIVINYTANVSGLPAQRTEQMSFSSSTGSITFDNLSTFSGVCSTCTFPHTVAGTAKILVVGISLRDTTTINSVTYAGQSLTSIRFDETTTKARTELWYLIDPPSGTDNIVITPNKNEKVVAGGVSFNGVHQTNPIGTHNGANDSSATTNPSVELTTTVDDVLIVDVVSTTFGPMTPGASQTERWDLIRNPLRGSGSTKQTSSAGSYTMSWTNDGGLNEWAMSAVALRPADQLCGPDGTFGTNRWTMNSFLSDLVEPNIINTNEGAIICAKLAYPVYTNGIVKVTVSTDSGYTKTNSTTAN